jgi:antitoxin (DNA-binding transcriptional repressor) of toxin-antitoxin stability system
VQRINVSEAERDFSSLIHQVCTQGVSIELERENKVIARITPAGPSSPLQIRDLNTFLESLPKLGDDAESFAQDVQAVRRAFPAEANPWD